MQMLRATLCSTKKINGRYTLVSATTTVDFEFYRSQKKVFKLKINRIQRLINFNDTNTNSFPKERAMIPKNEIFRMYLLIIRAMNLFGSSITIFR